MARQRARRETFDATPDGAQEPTRSASKFRGDGITGLGGQAAAEKAASRRVAEAAGRAGRAIATPTRPRRCGRARPSPGRGWASVRRDHPGAPAAVTGQPERRTRVKLAIGLGLSSADESVLVRRGNDLTKVVGCRPRVATAANCQWWLERIVVVTAHSHSDGEVIMSDIERLARSDSRESTLTSRS